MKRKTIVIMTIAIPRRAKTTSAAISTAENMMVIGEVAEF
jgi:hypothetical protein